MILLLWILQAQATDAPDPTRYTGQPVLGRFLSAPNGGLPEEDLEPLLQVQQGDLYSPQEVRQDISTLYRIGAFASVEVEVENGALPDENGEPIPGVFLTYKVYPPPRLERIHLTGNHALGRDAILRAVAHVKGEPFFPEEAETVEAAIRRAYAAKGWETVQISVTPHDEDGLVELRIGIEEGEPQRISAIRDQRRGPLSSFRLQWLLWKHHLAVHRPYADADLRAFSEDLKEILLKKGYYEGRVRVTPVRTKDGTELAIVVEPKRHYRIHVEGRGMPTANEVATTLRLSEGNLLSRHFAKEASERLAGELQSKGYLSANVTVQLEEADNEVQLLVEGTRGPLWRLGRTEFTGDPQETQRFLRGALQQASPHLLEEGRFTERATTEALAVMEEYYRSRGYLSAKIKLQEYKPRARRGKTFLPGADPEALAAATARPSLLYGQVVPVDLTISVHPGPQTILTDYHFSTPPPDPTAPSPDFPDSDRLNPLLEPLKNQPLNPSTLDERCRQIAQLFQEAGYLHADARPITTLTADGTNASINILINPGPRVYLRSVLIQGYSRTRRSVIQREISLKPGDVLSPTQLTDIRKRLYDLDLFSKVDVEAVGDEDRIKDLLVTVEERPNLYFEVGGSAATDQGVQAFGRAGHRNLFGLGNRLTLLGQGGIGWAGNAWSLDPGAVEWRAAGRYEAPGIPIPGSQLAADVLFNAQDQERYFRLESSGFAASFRFSLGGRSSTELAYRVQFRRLLDADPALLLSGDPWRELMGISTSSSVSFPSPVRPESGLQLSVLLDYRDDAFSPRKGWAASLELGMADGLARLFTPTLPEEASWLKGELAVSAHVPMGALGWLFRLRAGSAFVGGDETLPVEERFRLGGGSTMRGFDVDSIGPANHSAPGEISFPASLEPIIAWAGREHERWVPTGGDTMAMGSVELKIPFTLIGLRNWDNWQLALFSDVGNVWFLKPEITTDSASVDPTLRYSLGFGIRRGSAVGPIQLDVGFNPGYLQNRGEEPLFEGFVPVRLHVSLGAL